MEYFYVMGTVRFEIRKEKIDKDGKSPIRLIYQLHGQRKYYNTGIKLLTINWDASNQLAVYVDKRTAKKLFPSIQYDLFLTDEEKNEINTKLSGLTFQVKQIEKRFELDKITYTCEMVVEHLKVSKDKLTKRDESSTLLYAYIDKYIEDHKGIRQPGSLTVYSSLKAHLKAYESKTGAKVAFSKIDVTFFQSFRNFLIKHRSLNNTTVAKQLSTVKTFLNYARAAGVVSIDREKYKDFKITKEKLEVIALTMQEFLALYNMDLTSNKRLDQVRDVFCFSCASGLRYSDLLQLKREHIKQDRIILTVKKTGELLTIPLNTYTKEILRKYQDKLKPLPVISNQKMNEYLKEIGEKAGINDMVEIVRMKGSFREVKVYPKYDLLSVHVGRKTFVTLSLTKGMKAEEVMAITGHSDYKSFQRYLHITNDLKRDAMTKAWDE